MFTVLLVEDSDSDAVLIEETLKTFADDEKFSCVRARSLREGIGIYNLRRLGFDVVLLDLGLPECQGIDTVSRWFLEVGVRTPVIVLSGLEDKIVRVDAVRLGAQDYITKDELVGGGGILWRAIYYAIERSKGTAEYMKRSNLELELARQKLIEIAASLHKVFVPS